VADRRAELLAAAVRVFARDGFHGARVGDIAEEAGVAHGLLYHYFRSKEEVLETIFRSSWQELVLETDRIEHSGLELADQLRRFASVFLGSWLADPDLVRVLIREIARSPEVGKRIAEIGSVFVALGRMIERARERGEVRADVDARLATFVFYGALEEILTGWVLGQLPGAEADVRQAVDTVVDVVATGLRQSD
jgi:TetR/AcrR family transcriptional regulator, fatty acid metabolism regulator protein